ncbi:MAG: 16S rRNA (guanine(966)-N(2))-methyltransferase RsmD [Bacillota bacterium]
MRIITGSQKGRKLISGKNSNVRPTQDRIKEAVYNMLGQFVIGCRGLDLFAGFGGLGLEALSRGAEFFTFIEKNYKNSKIIKKNVQMCGFEEQVKVITIDVFKFLSSFQNNFELIFMDPPYDLECTEKVLSLIVKNNIIHPRGIIVSEHHQNEVVIPPDKLNTLRQKNYGDTVIEIYELKEAKNEN